MTLNEFISELDKELNALPEDRQKEIINDFEIQIEKAIALGDTEEYLLKILGDPRKVAEKFIAEEIIENEPEQQPEQQSEVTEKMTHPVTGNFAAEMKKYNINQLVINGEMVDIKIEKGKRLGIKFLSYTHKGKLKYEIEYNQLTIHHNSSKGEVKFNNIIDFIKKRKQLKKDEIVLTWPGKLDRLTVNNEGGKVIISDIEAEAFKIKTKEGAIETVGLTGNYGGFQSSMGTLKAESSDFKNLYMKTEMGRITAGGVKAERYNLVTELGKISLDNLTPDSDLKALSKMGSVSVNYRTAPENTKIVARANVGKVKNALEQNKITEQLYRAEYMSEMGSVKITLS